ncbi:CPBP family intramembrane glutamic endopeptidase [Lentzea albidocapillata]|uniref:CAAX prenyl protease 2/Lysostaphin resistance protein A-like domain-containing protein n=1 Tax=Lentzea albidocapillata TaxID=40571 RepID=A0A1W2FSU8_9PSEU|nr:CPBP family intramembrane glutamic endopeptidase [Lentzea albidocapillata]SMD24698.1 hypothetical protein SAMN05660733_07804 [Lentzea albidocapillata]
MHEQPGGFMAGLRMLIVFVAAEVAFLALSLLTLIWYTSADPTIAEEGRLPDSGLLVLLIVPPVGGALVAIACTSLFGAGQRTGRWRRELAVRSGLRSAGLGAAIGLAGLLVTIPAAIVWANWVGGDQATSSVGEAFADRQMPTAAAVTVFLVVWLVAPAAEEVLFRGALWRSLEHWRLNRWVVFAVTSVLFSLAHLELLRTPLLLVLSIPVGLARMFTGSLIGAIVAHQVNNLLPALALLLALTGNVPQL